MNTIQQIRTHHRNFINDQQVYFSDDLVPPEALNGILRNHSGWESKKRMDGLAHHINCGQSRRSQDSHSFGGGFPEILQQRGLSRSGTSGDKNRFLGMFHQPERKTRTAIPYKFGFGGGIRLHK